MKLEIPIEEIKVLLIKQLDSMFSINGGAKIN